MGFGIKVDCIPIMCDNSNAVSIAKNSIHHKYTNHIDVRHHFLRDNVEKRLVEMVFCKTKDQVADILTKALGGEHFKLNHLHLWLIMGS